MKLNKPSASVEPSLKIEIPGYLIIYIAIVSCEQHQHYNDDVSAI
jgi:hypothetical protein